MPKPEGLIYKDIIGEVKTVKDDGTLECAISTDAVDRMGEVLDPNGVDMKNYSKNPVVLWAHDYSKPPIAKALWVRKKDNMILSKLKFANTEFAQEIKSLYEGGFMRTFSVGFVPKDWIDGDGKKGASRTYTSWELLEYSAVPVPANPEALALAMSKGLIKSDEMKSLMNTKMQEFNLEEAPTDTKPEPITSKQEDSSSELLSEVVELKNQLIAKEKEIIELKYKVFNLLKVNEKQLSEITARNLVNTVEEEVRRVIRKLQGKLD